MIVRCIHTLISLVHIINKLDSFAYIHIKPLTPVDLFDSEAALPNFPLCTGFNDRMFYGSRKNAAIWTDRFALPKTFEEKYNPKAKHHHLYHSESYLKYLMKHYEVPMELKPICAWRICSKWRLQ